LHCLEFRSFYELNFLLAKEIEDRVSCPLLYVRRSLAGVNKAIFLDAVLILIKVEIGGRAKFGIFVTGRVMQ